MLTLEEVVARLQKDMLLPDGAIEPDASLIADLDVDSLGLMLLVFSLEDLGNFAGSPEVLRHILTIIDLYSFYENGVNNHRRRDPEREDPRP